MAKINEKELKEIFIQIKKNNKSIFEKFYSKYNKLVYGIAYSILKNATDSEDIVQTVFTKIYELEKEKLPTKNEASWIYTLTKNEAISLLRKKNENIDLDSIYEIEDNNNEISRTMDKLEFNRLISKLNEKEKQIISLKILSNLSFEQIGKLLNEPTGTIKWRYYKSMNTLKILLSNLGMFIITFIIGLKTLTKKDRSNKKQESTTGKEEINQNTEILEDKHTEAEIQEAEQDKNETKKEYNNVEENIQENTIEQETVIITDIENNQESINYLGIGILIISGVFLVITIIFFTFFIKYQLKLKTKTSK